jgi:hypothetical protein
VPCLWSSCGVVQTGAWCSHCWLLGDWGLGYWAWRMRMWRMAVPAAPKIATSPEERPPSLSLGLARRTARPQGNAAPAALQSEQ